MDYWQFNYCRRLADRKESRFAQVVVDHMPQPDGLGLARDTSALSVDSGRFLNVTQLVTIAKENLEYRQVLIPGT